MNNNDLNSIIGCSVVFVIVSFLMGHSIGTPNYMFNDSVKSKLQQDAISNYRTEHEQIRFIIDSYYSGDKDANKQKEE